ncbi:MAG: response regulator [Chitinophagaceae bacterium]|nr:response regulator [Chitinophagaceae bacterium]
MSYNIILLDTDAKHANMIKDHLTKYSEYSIHVFTEAATCIAQLPQLKPSVIFLDAELKHDAVSMQEDTALLFHLKELSPDSEIVLYSGEEKLELILDQVKHGVHGFAIKSTNTKAKAEILLLSAIRHYKKSKEASFYKKLTILLVIVLIAVVIFGIVAYKYKLVKDDIESPFDV